MLALEVRRHNLYVCNTFTPAMLPTFASRQLLFEPMTEAQVTNLLYENPFVSAVGHQGTCDILTERLGRLIAFSRMNVRLEPEDTLIVTQLVTPRLPEGQVLSKEQVRALPIVYWKVTSVGI